VAQDHRVALLLQAQHLGRDLLLEEDLRLREHVTELGLEVAKDFFSLHAFVPWSICADSTT
jgi:hypothetical protein